MLEETWAYERKQARGLKSTGGDGPRAGFEEDFIFGEEDDNDYWDRPDITSGADIT